MGQRSQLFIRYVAEGSGGHREVRREAMYLHNNFGPYMLQRAAQLVKILDLHAAQGAQFPRIFAAQQPERVRGLRATFAVNQATGVVEGLGDHDDVSEYAVGRIDNNNGAMFVDIDAVGRYTICFATCDDLYNEVMQPRTAREYLLDEGVLTDSGEVCDYFAAISEQIEGNLAVLDAAEAEHLMDTQSLAAHWAWRPENVVELVS